MYLLIEILDHSLSPARRPALLNSDDEQETFQTVIVHQLLLPIPPATTRLGHWIHYRAMKATPGSFGSESLGRPDVISP